ncbi:MAG: DNA polymerase I [Kiloniellales bacterium]
MSKAPQAAKPKKGDHVFLVDGSGYIFRAYHALPPLNRKSDGLQVNAVLGFCNMLWKLLRDMKEGDRPTHLAVVFDKSEQTFRTEFYPEYKANRSAPPDDLIPQFGLIREATRAFNLPSLEMEGYEADDLIATYARLASEAGIQVTIVSSDKDLMQLVRPGVAMLDPVKNRPIGPAEVMEKFGVAPEKVIEVQALAGDSTDNVPGVPGIGVKTAAQLIGEYGDLETLLTRAGEIKQPKRRESILANADLARLSFDLVRLKNDVPLEIPLDQLGLKRPDKTALSAFFDVNNFNSVRNRLQKILGDGALEPGAAADRRTAKDTTPAGQPKAIGEGYELIQELHALDLWMAEALEVGRVGVDTETTGLDPLRAALVGVSLALPGGRACYVPLAHKAPGAEGALDLEGKSAAPTQIPFKKALAALKPLLEDEGTLKVLQNAKFDLQVFARQGIALAPYDDTMLLSYVLDGGAHGHGMDELSRLHLGHETVKFAEVAGQGKKQVTFDLVPLEDALAYAAEDADVTLRLHDVLKPRLVTERMVTVYETLERPLIAVLAEMEQTGIKVEREELRRLSNDFAKRIAKLEKEIYKLAGREFTIGSPKQLGEILFDEMGLEAGRKGKSGAYATGADILESLAAQGHDLPARVLDWRQLTKLKSTYSDALQTQIDPASGRVHTCYSQAVASTGRLSSNDPNLQNIPIRTEEGRKIRHAFVAEKGSTLLSVDYSQIELRLAAEIAEVPALKEAFLAGEDIHASTASQVFGVPIEGMDPMVRRRAKAINFGIIYGMSAFGLAANLGIPQGEAKAYIEAYFKRYPEIRDYMEATKEACRKRGFVTTLFGRKIHVPGIKDKNPAMRSFSERAAINAPIQGSAADIIKRAMIRLPHALADARLKARLLLQVHDELLFEVPVKEVEKTSKLVRAVMEEAPAPAVTLSLPLVAEAGVGASWDEAH